MVTDEDPFSTMAQPLNYKRGVEGNLPFKALRAKLSDEQGEPLKG
jgi:hypothetical protein